MPQLALKGGFVVLVDDADADLLTAYRWRAYPGEYVQASRSGRTVYLHVVVGERIQGHKLTRLEVDHVRHDKLDCRRGSLRVVTHAENMANLPKPRHARTSRYKGVHFDARRKQWAAQIMRRGKKRFIGRFDTEEDAARAYAETAVRLGDTIPPPEPRPAAACPFSGYNHESSEGVTSPVAADANPAE